MSLAADNVEMKGGHPPATKIGGRRVVNNRKDRRNDSESHEHRASSESSDEVVREIIDADLPAKMEKSYPTMAVKKMHEKPRPAMQPAHHGSRGSDGHVFQPRKQTH